MTLDEEGKLQKVKIESETPSHRLIEDCMLLANKAAAKMINFGIFRVHNEPQKKDIQNLLKELLPLGISVNYKNSVVDTLKEVQKKAKELGIEKYIDKMIIKTQQQAKYEAYNNGHFALGFEKYTHFTSPIRRYSDLILHRLLKSILHNNQKFREFILRNIESLVVKISELEREAMKIEWDFYDRKFARWANEKIGKIVKATVIDTKDPPIAKIEDEIVGARIFLKRKKVNLFEKVNVKIVNVNIATTKIKGEIIENNS
jgi:ribonuclease R